MFLLPSTLKNLMKQAYKSSGLKVARTEDDWIYLAGTYWEVSVKKDFIPKKTLGDIITLTGKLPEPGERFRATEDGNSSEDLDFPYIVQPDGFNPENILTVTDVVLIGTAGTTQRLLQDEDTGDIYVVNNVFVSIVSNAAVDEEHGEYRVQFPLFQKQRGILWENNVCRLRANFRSDEKNAKVLRGLRGVDITPEVPE